MKRNGAGGAGEGKSQAVKRKEGEGESKNANNVVEKERVQQDLVESVVEKIVVKGSKGYVYFKTKPEHYFVPGQNIVFYNFTKGGNATDLQRLNGRWPVKKKKRGKALSGKNVFFLTNVDETEDSIVLEFDTLGLSQKTFIGDEPKKEFDEAATISVRKTKFSLAFQNMLKKN